MARLASIIPHHVCESGLSSLFIVKYLLDGVDASNVVLPCAMWRLPIVVFDVVLFAASRARCDGGGRYSLWWSGQLASLSARLCGRCRDSYSFGGSLLGLFAFGGWGFVGRAATDFLKVGLEHVGCRLTMRWSV